MAWIIAYDPADGANVAAWDTRYWPLKHGSPILDLRALWVPSDRVPLLARLEETADLYLIHIPKEPEFAHTEVVRHGESVSRRVQQLLRKIRSGNVILGIEFTYHHNWSSNTIERIRIVHDTVTMGVPALYAMPSSGRALRETENRGEGSLTHRAVETAVAPLCAELVTSNKPVTSAAVEPILKRAGFELKQAENIADPKISLFCRTMQDTYNVPCATVQFDQVMSFVPRDWKLAGCQLQALYDAIEGSIEYARANGEAPTIASGVFTALNKADDELMARRGPTQRHKDWDRYHEANRGYPNGSLRVVRNPINRHARADNYSLHSPRIGHFKVFDPEDDAEEEFERWLRNEKGVVWKRKMSGRLLSNVPDLLTKREGAVRYAVKEYDGDRAIAAHDYVKERTYTSRFLLIDICAMRTPKRIAGRPRAMSGSRTDRRFVLAADLPIARNDFHKLTESNSIVRRWLDFADVLFFNDGADLGKIWWADEEKPVTLL